MANVTIGIAIEQMTARVELNDMQQHCWSWCFCFYFSAKGTCSKLPFWLRLHFQNLFDTLKLFRRKWISQSDCPMISIFGKFDTTGPGYIDNVSLDKGQMSTNKERQWQWTLSFGWMTKWHSRANNCHRWVEAFSDEGTGQRLHFALSMSHEWSWSFAICKASVSIEKEGSLSGLCLCFYFRVSVCCHSG